MRWRVSARHWPRADFCAESHGIFFLLTYLLLDRPKASTPERIISVSPGHAWVTLASMTSPAAQDDIAAERLGRSPEPPASASSRFLEDP
jgi:hypothetical protein